MCDWSQQPDTHIFCMDLWTTPGWGVEPLGDGVYEADAQRVHYTFRSELVTCPKCKAGEGVAV